MHSILLQAQYERRESHAVSHGRIIHALFLVQLGRRTLRCCNHMMQRDSRRIGLWRSGRERGVWLLDIQRAAAARSVCAAAYAASVIRDR